MSSRFRRFIWMLTRRKPMDVSEEAPTDLDRCLNTLDLTAMGVGATLGFGLYVLSGEVAAQKAGPGVVLSFMIAAIASTLSALCYAEFAAKVPKSGSAYAYSYITVGEFVAFVIGWNLTLEHVIGTASLARGYSGYLGSLFDLPSNKLNHSLQLVADINANDTTTTTTLLPNFLNNYIAQFDLLAFILTLLVTGLLLLGVQVSSKFQITFATINLSVACFIFICGLFKADFHNWNLTKEEIPSTAGEGGFLPFGITGVIAGAGTCFFAFVGFDGIAATAEEVKNPRKAIPNSILWTSGIIFITYCFMATIQTLIWPYWDQKQDAPLPYIFDKLGMHFAKWIVLIGVLAGLSTSFVGGFLPLPRILYAMARDGIIYRVLAIVSKRFKVPIVATIIGGIIIACLASMLEIDQLADMLSIGTLAAYSLVSISVLLLRYEYRKPKNCENPLPITFQDHLNTNGAINGNNNNNNNTNKNKISKINGNGKLNNNNIALAVNGVVLALESPDKKLINNEKKRKISNGSLNSNSKISNGSESPIASTNSGASSSGSDSVTNSTTTTTTTSSSSNCNNSSSASITGSSSSSSRSLISLFLDGTRGPGLNEIRRPDEQTTHISRVMILLLVIITTLLDYSFVLFGPTLYLLRPIELIVCGSLFLLTIIMAYLLNRLPIAEPSLNSFEVPLVPTIPLFSVIINTFLMLNLSIMTWIRFAVWMSIGFFIYFTYGIFESTGYKDSRCD